MKQIGCRVPPELLAAIEQARGDVPRERWIRRTLERALATEAPQGVEGVTQQGPPPPPPALRTQAEEDRLDAIMADPVIPPASAMALVACPECSEFEGHDRACSKWACQTCTRNGPPRTRPCAKCGQQAA